jgi:N-acetylmuramoyl-L-alanine amidase
MTYFSKIFLIAFCVICTVPVFAHHPSEIKKVVIDVGHGGDDTGQLVDGVFEKDVVLAIANKLVALNTREDLEIVLLRSEDRSLSLQERADLVNAQKPDFAVSLHANVHPNSSTNGAEAYVFPQSEYFEEARSSAQTLLNAISNEAYPNRGVKTARFFVLQNIDCPTVLLEVGFLTNPDNFEFLNSEEGQEELALKILSAL